MRAAYAPFLDGPTEYPGLPAQAQEEGLEKQGQTMNAYQLGWNIGLFIGHWWLLIVAHVLVLVIFLIVLAHERAP